MTQQIQGAGSGNPVDPMPAMFTIREWCERNRISQPFFFKIQREGIGPRTIRIGRRVLISREADEAWRREREAV